MFSLSQKTLLLSKYSIVHDNASPCLSRSCIRGRVIRYLFHASRLVAFRFGIGGRRKTNTVFRLDAFCPAALWKMIFIRIPTPHKGASGFMTVPRQGGVFRIFYGRRSDGIRTYRVPLIGRGRLFPRSDTLIPGSGFKHSSHTRLNRLFNHHRRSLSVATDQKPTFKSEYHGRKHTEKQESSSSVRAKPLADCLPGTPQVFLKDMHHNAPSYPQIRKNANGDDPTHSSSMRRLERRHGWMSSAKEEEWVLMPSPDH